MRQDEGIFRFARFIKQLALGVMVLIIAVVIFGALFVVRQVAPDESWRLAERELNGSVLRFGERPMRVARVYVRKGTNYFRAANGLLVATPYRLLFVGIEPRDKLSNADAPASIVTAEFANDTLLTLAPKRLYLFTTPGVIAQRGGREASYAGYEGHEHELDSLIAYVNDANTLQRREAAREHEIRIQVAEILNRPLYYEIKRGDALFNIAPRFGTTPEQLKTWNKMTTDRVRIRDTIMVKPPGRPGR